MSARGGGAWYGDSSADEASDASARSRSMPAREASSSLGISLDPASVGISKRHVGHVF